MYIRGEGVCKRLRNYATCDFLYIFFAQFNYFYYLCRTKSNNNPKHINPTNPNIMITKHLQGDTDFCFLRQCNVWRVPPFLQSFSQ